MTKNDPGPLVPYLRQSRAKERTISIDEQRRDVRAWADEAGVPLASEVIEQNVSGSKPWRERALGEAIEACERGETAGVIMAWQDRLSRENGLATSAPPVRWRSRTWLPRSGPTPTLYEMASPEANPASSTLSERRSGRGRRSSQPAATTNP